MQDQGTHARRSSRCPEESRGTRRAKETSMPDPRLAAVFRLGDRGEVVADIRDRLRRLDLARRGPGDPDDEYDAAVERAVRAFQQQRGLTADGVVGPGHLACARRGQLAARRPGARAPARATCQTGDDVIALQRRLLDLGFKTGRVDGRFGAGDRGGGPGVPAQHRASRPTAPAVRPRSRRSAGSPRWSRAAAPTRCGPRSASAARAPSSPARSSSSTRRPSTSTTRP